MMHCTALPAKRLAGIASSGRFAYYMLSLITLIA
jgi:hypothetical protein